MSHTPVTSGDRRAPMLGHDHRRVAAVAVSDPLPGTRVAPAAGSLVLHQRRRTSRAAARSVRTPPQHPETAWTGRTEPSSPPSPGGCPRAGGAAFTDHTDFVCTVAPRSRAAHGGDLRRSGPPRCGCGIWTRERTR